MIRAATLALSLALAAPPATAQERIAGFTLYVAPEDLHAPGGQRLTQPWQVIARDRENFHAFAIRQFADESDPVFVSQAARAQIPGLLARGRIEPEAQRILHEGRGIVHVELFMDQGALHALTVTSRRPGPYYPGPARRPLPAGGIAAAGPSGS